MHEYSMANLALYREQSIIAQVTLYMLIQALLEVLPFSKTTVKTKASYEGLLGDVLGWVVFSLQLQEEVMYLHFGHTIGIP